MLPNTQKYFCWHQDFYDDVIKYRCEINILQYFITPDRKKEFFLLLLVNERYISCLLHTAMVNLRMQIYVTLNLAKILVVGHSLYFQKYTLINFTKSDKVSDSQLLQFLSNLEKINRETISPSEGGWDQGIYLRGPAANILNSFKNFQDKSEIFKSVQDPKYQRWERNSTKLR